MQQFSSTLGKSILPSAAILSRLLSFIDGWIVASAFHARPLAKIKQQSSSTSPAYPAFLSQGAIVIAEASEFSIVLSSTSAPIVSHKRVSFDATVPSHTTFYEFHGLDAHMLRRPDLQCLPELQHVRLLLSGSSAPKHCAHFVSGSIYRSAGGILLKLE